MTTSYSRQWNTVIAYHAVGRIPLSSMPSRRIWPTTLNSFKKGLAVSFFMTLKKRTAWPIRIFSAFFFGTDQELTVCCFSESFWPCRMSLTLELGALNVSENQPNSRLHQEPVCWLSFQLGVSEFSTGFRLTVVEHFANSVLIFLLHPFFCYTTKRQILFI